MVEITKKQLNSARSELQANKNKLNANKSYSQKQLASAKAKIASGKEQLEKSAQALLSFPSTARHEEKQVPNKLVRSLLPALKISRRERQW